MEAWGAATLGSLITAVLGALGLFLVRIWRTRHSISLERDEAEHRQHRELSADEQKREGVVVRELRALVEEVRRERIEDRRQLHELRNEWQQRETAQQVREAAMQVEVAQCRADRARAFERIAALEEALENAGIPHKKFDPSGSNTHAPLPPTRPKPPEGNQ